MLQTLKKLGGWTIATTAIAFGTFVLGIFAAITFKASIQRLIYVQIPPPGAASMTVSSEKPFAPDTVNKDYATRPDLNARAASPKASNRGFETGSFSVFHSGCHCTDIVKPGASCT